MKNRKLPLFRQFAVYSIFAFLITGIVLSIVVESHVVKIFKIYIPANLLNTHITDLNLLIGMVMFSGLIILYFLLLRIIYNASKELSDQTESIQIQKDELEKAYIAIQLSYKDTVLALSKAVDARDSYTAGHSERVAKIAMDIAQKLGFPKKKIEQLEIAALFHDIGKLGIPDSILLKPEKLNEAEIQIIQQHPIIGANILKDVIFLKDTLSIILHHHERYSGEGYPDGIKGDQIPIESRIISIADTYDAMTSDRPYRKGMSHLTAIDEIIRYKGIQFDPLLVNAFLSIVDANKNEDK